MGHELPITKSGDTRQQILDTAKNIILGKGFSAVGLNEILTSAGVPKGSFYHYFKSKEQFGDALLEDYFETYLANLELILRDDGTSSAARLMQFFQNWLNTQSTDTTEAKCLVVKLSAEVTDLSEAMRLTLKQGTERVIARLAQCIEEGIAKGEFPSSLDAKAVTQEIYCMWIGATLLTKVNHTRDGLECAMQATRSRLNLNT
ncbi:MAG TPA: TetR/AcrR family transcriptional regulator [Methylophilaceae bacterium]|jgi:TetR/AcrR family transcriptional repressor of nem operon